jgi:hypothetical protein
MPRIAVPSATGPALPPSGTLAPPAWFVLRMRKKGVADADRALAADDDARLPVLLAVVVAAASKAKNGVSRLSRLTTARSFRQIDDQQLELAAATIGGGVFEPPGAGSSGVCETT